MTAPWIIDAHLHFGPPGAFFSARPSPADLDAHRRLREDSGGRFRFLAPFDPRRADASLRDAADAAAGPGLCGLKLHPTVHGTAANDPAYEPAWRFAADHGLPIFVHSWSVSHYNPSQRLSTPEQFAPFARAFPAVKLVLGHAGGRGTGRREAVRMAAELPNVYVDISGDIFGYRLIEGLVAAAGPHKVLFGSDWPWFDPRCRLSHVLLADVDDAAKRRILRDNAAAVFGEPAEGPSPEDPTC